MKDRRTKGLTKVEVKDESQGLVTAVFATLNVIDSDGDVTVPGAFGEQVVRMSAYGHTSWSGKLPVGRGEIKEIGEEAIFEGRFFLNTEAGRDTFEVVKEMSASPGLQEWSYGFDVLEGDAGQFEGQDVFFLRSLKVHEVSPVLLGAGVDTRTLAVKGAGMELSQHLMSVAEAVTEVMDRVQGKASFRAGEGRDLSKHQRKALADLSDVLHSAETDAAALLGVQEPEDGLKSDESQTFPGLDLEAMFTTLRR